MRIIRKTPLAKNRKLGISAFVLPVLLATVFLLPGCNMFNKPLSDFLEYWTDVAQINRHSFDGSYPATGGLTNLPSGGDRVITCYVINPQNYDLGIEVTFDPNLPGWDPIRTSNHPVFSTTSNQGTVEQDPIDKSIIRLTLNENALASLDGTGSTLNPTISIVEPNSRRDFGSYSIPLRVNSAPNKAKNAVIMTWDDDTVYKYAVLFYLPEDTNNQYSPDRDVVSMTVSGFSGKYNTTFEIPASGDIGGVENTYAQGDFSPVTSGDSFISLNGYRFVGIKTDFVVGSVVPSCTVTLRDSSGLESTTDVSTTTTKLTEVYVDPTNGNDGYPGSDILPVKTIGKAMEKLSGMTNTAIILVGDIEVQNTLEFTASYPNITLKGGATPVTLTYSGTGRAITVSGGKLTLGENITITGADDGAVELTGGEFVMETDSTLSGNGESPGYDPLATPPNGGAVCVRDGTFTMKGGTINSNEASSGGAVYVDGGSFTMSGGTISGNNATQGGGVFVCDGGTFNMSGNAKIQYNEATTGSGNKQGGGVCMFGGKFTMSDSAAISNNKAGSDGYSWGGGVFMSGGEFTMSGNAAISNNEAYSSGSSGSYGGGVFMTGGTFTMSGSAVIRGNSANTSGGGVNVAREVATFSMEGGTIGGTEPDDANTASDGGGVYSAGIFTIRGGKILGQGNGQGNKTEIYSANTFTITGSPTITDCTVTLEQGARIDVQGLNASALSSVQVNLSSYKENEVLLENAGSKDICGKFALDNPPSAGVWWIGLNYNKQNGILRYINGTLSGGTVTVTTPPSDKDSLQDLVNDSADGGYKVEITGDMDIDVDSAVSVPDGADVAIKPDNSNTVNITASGKTTVFDVQDGGSLTLGGGGGVVNVSGDQNASPPGAMEDEKTLINISSGGTVTIADNANIQNNKAGRGVTVTDGTLIMTGGSIKGNTGGFHYGSGVYVSGQDACFKMSGGEISGNELKLGKQQVRQGAGVLVCNGATFTLSNNGKIIDNSGYEGVGVCVKETARFTMNGGEISRNKGEGTSGGVYLVSSSIMYMNGGTIKNNSAKNVGAYLGGGGVHIGSGCTFTGSTDPSTTASITGNSVDNINVDVYVQNGGIYNPVNVQVGTPQNP